MLNVKCWHINTIIFVIVSDVSDQVHNSIPSSQRIDQLTTIMTADTTNDGVFIKSFRINLNLNEYFDHALTLNYIPILKVDN